MKSKEQAMLEQILARMDIILAKLGAMSTPPVRKLNAPPARKSKLEPYTQEILAMRDKGISEQKIVEFLETERGLKITRQNLNYFLKKQENNNSSDDTALEDVEDEKLEQERIRLTAIKLPKWVDAELFEAHLQHCYSCHKSTNKDAQRGKLKQLEMARQKGHDVHVIQANAVGGGWLNFYPAFEEEAGATVTTPPYICNNSQEALSILTGVMDKLRNKAIPEKAVPSANPPKEIALAHLSGVMDTLKKKS